MKFLLRLYPTAWRARYEDEVARLLDDSGPGAREALDLLHGALDAHANPGPLGLPSGAIRVWFSSEHIGAASAILAGVAWLLPQLALSVLAVSHSQRADLMSPVAFMAVPGLFAALAMASLLVRHVSEWHDRIIAATAVALVSVGSGAMIVMLFASAAAPGVAASIAESDELMMVGTGTILVGNLVGVLALWRCTPVSRRSLVLLALACVLDALFLADTRDVSFAFAVQSAVDAGLGVLLGLGWIIVGRSAVKAGMRPPDRPLPAVGAINAR